MSKVWCSCKASNGSNTKLTNKPASINIMTTKVIPWHFEFLVVFKLSMWKWAWFAWELTWTCSWNTFSYEWFQTKTRFDTEETERQLRNGLFELLGKGQSETALFVILRFYERVSICRPFRLIYSKQILLIEKIR